MATEADARRVAVIDLGSNTFRLVVFADHPDWYGPTDEIRETVRLSAGVREGRLAESGIARAAVTARTFARFCRTAGIDHVLAVATSAIREAANGDVALAAVGGPEGVAARIISADEEARYGWLGVANTTTLTDGAVLDVGGGSVQVVAVGDRRPIASASGRLGAVRMTEDILGPDPGSRRRERLRRHVADWVTGEAPALVADRLVGIGGTIRTLAAMDQRRREHPLRDVHGHRIPLAALAELIDQMAALPAAQRDTIPGLKADRADITLAGAIVVHTIAGELDASEIEVCGAGLREGLFFEWRLRESAEPIVADVRREGVRNLAARYQSDLAHSERVTDLALRIHEQLVALGVIPADPVAREWLWAAGLLHDVGTIVDYHDHHRHGEYLVLSAGLPGFTHRELAMVALLVRGHRKRLPRPGPLAGLLEPGDADLLARLVICLRLAEQLERDRAGVVGDVNIDLEARRLRLRVRAGGDPGVALWSAAREAWAVADALDLELEVLGASPPA